MARRQHTYFKYGTSSASETILAKLGDNVRGGWDWVLNQLNIGADAAKNKAQQAKEQAHKEL